MVVFHVWSGRGPRSRKLSQISKWIFQLLVDRNLSLEMSSVPSHLNQADCFSRRLSSSDAMPSPKSWEVVQRRFGGVNGHDLDLMSLDSNVQRDWQGNPLKHFTPYPTPGSSGVNVFNQDLSGRASILQSETLSGSDCNPLRTAHISFTLIRSFRTVSSQ